MCFNLNCFIVYTVLSNILFFHITWVQVLWFYIRNVKSYTKAILAVFQINYLWGLFFFLQSASCLPYKATSGVGCTREGYILEQRPWGLLCVNAIITRQKKIQNIVPIQPNEASSNEASQFMQSWKTLEIWCNYTLKKRIEVTYISPDDWKHFAKSEARTREPNSQGFVSRCYTDC